MSLLTSILKFLPEVRKPTEKRLSFKQKLNWTLAVIVAFFFLSSLPLLGLGQNALGQFEQFSILLGASFGSLLSLGIGPIVTGSIVIQLLVGSGILKIDNTTPEGRAQFQGLQKFLTIFFIIFESLIYVFMGGLLPSQDLIGTGVYIPLKLFLVLQIFIGGYLVVLMDEVVSKWGFGSGVSLFIVAGVSSSIFIRAFSPLTSGGTLALGTGQGAVGQVWVFFSSLIGRNPTGAALALSTITSTILVFLFSVYAQSMKVEIPLSFGRVRGHGIRWPLRFLYTSNIPVILTAALIANIQLWARLLENWGHPLLGTFVGGRAATGLVTWIYPPNILQLIITGSFRFLDLAHMLSYTFFMIVGAVTFSVFWVQTSGMDSASQARQIISSGLQIPGFRRDPRVLEQILDRYIIPLTVMGAVAVGFLASAADFLGALTNGTSLLLSVMIIYKLYEDIAQHHMADMYPMLRNVME